MDHQLPAIESPKPLRIAFVGRAKVGRTFCAEHLRVRHGFKRKSIIDPVNRFIKILYFYDRDTRVTWEVKRSFHDAIYKIDNELLIDYLLARVKMSPLDVVVDDIRYMNEAQKLKEEGFIIIRVTSPVNKSRTKQALGRTAAPGTLLLNELYNKDFTSALQVDYSVHNVDNDATRAALDHIMINIDKNRSNL